MIALALLVITLATAKPPTKLELATLVVPEPTAPTPRDPANDIRRLLRPEASILAARNRLDQDLEKRTTELFRLRELETALANDLDLQTRHFQGLSWHLSRSRQAVRDRIAVLDRLQRTSATALTLGRSSWEDVDYAQAAVQRLQADDRARVFAYRLELAAWKAAEADLARRTTNLERTRKSIGFIEQDLEWDHDERAALEAAVVKEPEFYATYAHEMEKLDTVVAAKVEELIALAPNDRTRLYMEETKGSLAVPIRNADLAGGFGTRSYLGVRSQWAGIHLVPMRAPRAGEEVEIRATYWGWVAWTGWLQGLGKVVIVDHTLGYTSMYAHLATIAVMPGEKVKTGTPLGTMGATESYFGARLYMEIRKDGVALDPLPWMK